ncbi:MAG: FHA domain-containing protein [Anaerolinea sp.]|nr:FHA domain-containing protein [Anaerolinea sp.]MCC6973729.1 FHA domain-containing protein [Anaerolineae bacterium]
MSDNHEEPEKSKPLPSLPDDKPTIRIQMSDRRMLAASVQANTPQTAPIKSDGIEPPPVPEDKPEIKSEIKVESKPEVKIPEPSPAPETLTCTNCGKPYRTGELVCARCGHVFVAAGKTTKVEEENINFDKKAHPTGEALAPDQTPITFEIDNRELNLSVKDRIVVGRISDPATDSPDVDLSAFHAGELGVSRRHVRIRRNGALLYVADLRSTNGTLLNGRKLIPEGERLLRSGDELRLGHLRIRVRF